LKDLCDEARKSTPPAKYLPFFPFGGFDIRIQEFSEATINLRNKRHLADYDPRPRFRTSNAQQAISTARSAVRRFAAAREEHRKAFLTLLVCPPRLN
jgi:hypothetical protein